MNKECKVKEWDVKLKAKKKPRFKPGSELADKVNIMNVDINEEIGEDSATTDIKMEIETMENDVLKLGIKKKSSTKFKAGADLTDKVNLLSVDFDEEATENSDSCSLKMKLESEDKERIELNLNKRKTHFKAGSDLTEKVNLAELDWVEEQRDEFQTLSVSIKVSSIVCPIKVLDKVDATQNNSKN